MRLLNLLRAAVATIVFVAGAALAQPQNANTTPGAFASTARDLWSGGWSIGATQDRPTWSWDARSGTLPSGATFTRAGGARQMLSSGLLGWAPENLLARSNDFANAAWGKQGGGAGVAPVVTSAFAAGPDGTPAAATRIQFQLNATGGGDDISYVVQNVTAPGQKQTKLWVKLNTGTTGNIAFRCGDVSQSIAITDQWQQISVSSSTTHADANLHQFGLRSGVTGVGPATLDVMVAYAQAQRTPNADTSYVATVAAAYYGARFDFDPLTGQPLGYLAEMQSTNAVTNSQALTATGWAASNLTVTDNAVASPDGTTTAATIKENSAAAVHSNTWTSTSVVTGQVYGFSFFAKNISGSRWIQWQCGGGAYFANFNPATGAIGSSAGVTSLTARQLPNGWWRFTGQFIQAATGGFGFVIQPITGTASTGAESYAGDNASTIAVWGVQFETAGVGVTSYIPTSGATATRSQDILTMPLSSMPGWDATRGGVLKAAYRLHTLVPSSPGYNQNPLYLYKTDHNNAIHFRAQDGGGGSVRPLMTSGGSTQFQVTPGATPAAFVRTALSFGYGLSRGAASLNGASVASVSGTFALPVGPMDTIDFGRYASHGLNGTIERVDAYFKGERPDGFVQAVSR